MQLYSVQRSTRPVNVPSSQNGLFVSRTRPDRKHGTTGSWAFHRALHGRPRPAVPRAFTGIHGRPWHQSWAFHRAPVCAPPRMLMRLVRDTPEGQGNQRRKGRPRRMGIAKRPGDPGGGCQTPSHQLCPRPGPAPSDRSKTSSTGTKCWWCRHYMHSRGPHIRLETG
jgi:hypothetical protein